MDEDGNVVDDGVREWAYNVYRQAGSANGQLLTANGWLLVGAGMYHRFEDVPPLAGGSPPAEASGEGGGHWYIIRKIFEDGSESNPSEPLFVRNEIVEPIRGSRFPKPTEEMRHWYHKDHLGTPRLVTDDAGNVVSEHKYEPFGVELPSDSSAGMWPNNLNTRRFTSHERDFETSLDYMGRRHYTSRDARFLSPDVLAGNVWDPQGLNRYTYTNNNPIKYFDPTGAFSIRGARSSETQVKLSRTNISDPFGINFRQEPGGGGGGGRDPAMEFAAYYMDKLKWKVTESTSPGLELYERQTGTYQSGATGDVMTVTLERVYRFTNERFWEILPYWDKMLQRQSELLERRNALGNRKGEIAQKFIEKTARRAADFFLKIPFEEHSEGIKFLNRVTNVGTIGGALSDVSSIYSDIADINRQLEEVNAELAQTQTILRHLEERGKKGP